MKLGVTFQHANLEEAIAIVDHVPGDFGEYIQASEDGCHVIIDNAHEGTFASLSQLGFNALPLTDDMTIIDYANMVDPLPESPEWDGIMTGANDLVAA